MRELHQTKREGRAIKRVLLTGLAVSLLYGIVTRFAFGLTGSVDVFGEKDSAWYTAFSVMTVAFLFVVPFVMGFSVVYLGRIQRFWRALWFPKSRR